MSNHANLVSQLALTFMLAIGSGQAFADATWTAITNRDKPECGPKGPSACQVDEEGASFNVEFTYEETSSGKNLSHLSIRNLKSGASETYSVTEMNTIPYADPFQLYLINMRARKIVDLALFAYSSAREGEMYYYFIYIPAKQRFIMSNDTFPKLTFDRNKRRFLSAERRTPYRLNSQMQFEPIETKR